MTRGSKGGMANIHVKTIKPQMMAMIQSDQLTLAKVLLSEWSKCQSERQDYASDCETEWSEEEYSDWPDEEVPAMSPENRELWESFHSNPLHFTCLPNVMALHSNHSADDEEELVSPSCHENSNAEWSEGEDSDWSDEGISEENQELWESFFNNGDPYNPFHSSCPTKVVLKASDMQQNHMSTPTATEVEEHNSGQRKKKLAKKVTFSEEVTIHTLEAWGVESRTARDGSCWMEMARDRDRFRRRVAEAEVIICPCLTAQHRATILDRLLNTSNSSSLMN